MKRIAFLLVAVAIVAGIVVSAAPTSGPANEEAAAPIYGITIPSGYRDWKLISVAHEEGNLNDLRAILGNDVAIKAYRQGNASVPGRHNHCPNSLELRPVGRKQQSLWPFPIFRSRAPTGLVPSVYGQGLKKVRRDGRLGFRPV